MVLTYFTYLVAKLPRTHLRGRYIPRSALVVQRTHKLNTQASSLPRASIMFTKRQKDSWDIASRDKIQ